MDLGFQNWFVTYLTFCQICKQLLDLFYDFLNVTKNHFEETLIFELILNFKILVAKLMKFFQNLENFTKKKKSQNKAQKYILAMKLRNSKMAGKFEFPIQKNSFSR